MHTHKALVRHGAQIAVARVPTPSAGPGEILVGPLVVGVCGTDLQILTGIRSDAASILGHEGLAKVVSIGPGTRNFQVGDTVVFNPVNQSNQNEILGHSIDGLFQQRVLVTAAQLEWGLLADVPHREPCPTVGALAEPLAAVLYGFELVETVVAPDVVVVVGAGPAGLLAVIAAQERGAKRVLLVTNSSTRRQWAAAKGILPGADILVIGNGDDAGVLRTLSAAAADALFLCTPRTAALPMLEAALPALRDGGCVDLFGGFADGDHVAALPGLELNALRRANVCGAPRPGRTVEWRTAGGKTVWLTGHRGTHRDHLARAQTALFARPDRFRRVVTHRCSLDAAPALLARLARRGKAGAGADIVKAVVDLRLEGHVLDAVADDRSLH